MKPKINLIQKSVLLLVVLLFSCVAANALPDLTVNTGIVVDPYTACTGQPQILVFNVSNIGNMAVSGAVADIYVNGAYNSRITGVNVTAGGIAKIITAIPASNSGYIRLDPDNIISEGSSGGEDNNIKVFTPTAVSCSNSYTNTPLQRYTNGAQMDRFYTTNSIGVPSGFSFDHNEGKISTSWVSGTTPLFQFYNSGATSHFYTTKTDQPSLQDAVNNNYKYEKVQGYVYTYQASGTVPLDHLYNPSRIEHFYTTSDVEKSNAVNNLGFQYKGIEGYVYPNDPVYAYDLQAVDVWASGTPTAGQATVIYYQIKNNKSPVSSYRVALFIDNVYQGYEEMYNLGEGGYATGYLSITTTEGYHNVKIAVDYGNQWSETDETNNEMTRTIYWQAAPLPAPKPASFSNQNPGNGSIITYTYSIEAHRMDSDYRTMIHFLDDNNNVVINDDHWLNDVKGFKTNSASFTGNIAYTRSITIPSNFSGRLRMTTGFYNLSTPNMRTALDTKYVPELWQGEYKVGEINVVSPVVQITAPKTASFSDSNPEPGDSITYTLNYEAGQMDRNYRTFVHFIDDSGKIIINDDHWLNETKGFGTSSPLFSGTVSYSRIITLPSGFKGHLRMVTGFYSYDNGVEGNRVELSMKYVQDADYLRYLVGELTVEDPAVGGPEYYDIPYTYGRISWFASDAGDSCKITRSTNPDCSLSQNTCGGSLIYGKSECCNEGTFAHFGAFGDCLGESYSDVWYAAMQWPYADAPADIKYQVKDWWHNRKIKVTNPANGKAVILAAKDWGPASSTGRVIDVSKMALDVLQANTDTYVSIELADQNLALGPVEATTDTKPTEGGPLHGKKIVLDPGHGDGYPGAAGTAGEAEATHKISSKLKVLLEALGAQVNETPSYYSLSERAELANDLGADIFVSIHFNGASKKDSSGNDVPDPTVRGVETFYGTTMQNGGTGTPEKDMELCTPLAPEVKAIISSPYHRNPTGIIGEDFAVLRETTMPACLVELEYMTHIPPAPFSYNNKIYTTYKDLFLGDDYQSAAAIALRNGILDYFQVSKPVIPYSEGQLVKEVGNNDVYVVKNQRFQLVKDETSFCYAISGNLQDLSKYKELPSGEIAAYDAYGMEIEAPESYYSFSLPPAEGMLVKEACSPKVYVYQNGEYRWIADEYTFNAMGYDFNDVVDVAYNRISQQNNFGEPIKLQPSCSLPQPKKTNFVDVDALDANWNDTNIEDGTVFSYPLDTDTAYSPENSGICSNFKICNYYRGAYSHAKEGSGSHAGVDILAPEYSAPDPAKVYAIADGIISNDIGGVQRKVLSLTGEDCTPADREACSDCYNGLCQSYNGGYGGMVIIKHEGITLHGKPLYSVYMHMREFNPNLKVGDYVKAGTYLGKLANDMKSSDNLGSGYSSDPHLHFQLDLPYGTAGNDRFGQPRAWPYEPQLYTNVPDNGYLNNVTVNPMKLLNRFGYYMPSELEDYYDCGNQVPAGTPAPQEAPQIGLIDFGEQSQLLEWDDSASPTFHIAISKDPSFSEATDEITYNNLTLVDFADTPTYIKVRTELSDWSDIVTVQLNMTNFTNSTTSIIAINSSNTILDLNGATITGGIVAYSGYDAEQLSNDLQGIDGSTTREQIDSVLDQAPMLENITIMNGNFVDCNVGINLSLVRNVRIINNNFTNCQSGIMVAAIGSEIASNRITLGSASPGNAIAVGGMDILISSNNITGGYASGIAMLGWNITAESNTLDGANSGIGMLGFYNSIIKNSITNSKNAVSGIFVFGANVSGNRMDTNENGISIACFDTSTANSNTILSSSHRAIALMQFLKNKCSKDSSIMNNLLIEQTKPAINVMGTDIENDTIAYNNTFRNNTYCDSEEGCGIIAPEPAKKYTIVYVPGELRNISGVVMGNNFENMSEWVQSPMEKINSTYHLTFENISAGEREFNIKFNVEGVNYDYYALTTQGMSGDVYVNGMKMDCGYTTYYPDRLAANYRISADGEGNFTRPSGADNLPVCNQLCSEERLGSRVAWLSNGSLHIPGGLFTGNCYKEKDGTNYGLIFSCPVEGKDIKLGGWFDSWQGTVNFTAQNSQSCGITDSTFSQKFYSAPSGDQSRGFAPFYREEGYNYWLDLDSCHPDVILASDNTHKIVPSERTASSAFCS